MMSPLACGPPVGPSTPAAVVVFVVVVFVVVVVVVGSAAAGAAASTARRPESAREPTTGHLNLDIRMPGKEFPP